MQAAGGRHRSGTRWRRVASVGSLIAVIAAACTDQPEPAPPATPPAEEAVDPAPTGVQVGVVMPARTDPASAEFHDADAQLADLAEERAGDVAGIRAVVPDEAGFEVDIAALMVEEGADLVCVLGSDGVRTARALSSRFPAARFCALGDPLAEGPDNVELFAVAHEELGHVIGIALAASARGGPVGLVLDGDRDAQMRRRAGARAALSGADVAIDAIVGDAAAAASLVEDVPELALEILALDVTDPGPAAILAASAPTWVGPRAIAVDAPDSAALARWSLRADVVVAAAVDALVDGREPDAPPLGFTQGLFRVTFAEDIPDAVRGAIDAAADELGRGTRDPLAPPSTSPFDADPDPAAHVDRVPIGSPAGA